MLIVVDEEEVLGVEIQQPVSKSLTSFVTSDINAPCLKPVEEKLVEA